MDMGAAERKITAFISGYFAASGKKLAVVGLSGGLDSAVALALCVKALGRKNALAVFLPSRSTPAEDMKDAKGLAKKIGVLTAKYDIEPILRAYGTLAVGRLPRANFSARVRMAALYSIAGRRNGLVVGTGDKSEFMLGYFTKYGDGGADIFPIGGLYKSEVRALGKHLGIPQPILAKQPSPALWKGQTAKGELGFSYDEADQVLAAIERGGKKSHAEGKFGKKIVAAILKRMESNRHKLFPAPICIL